MRTQLKFAASILPKTGNICDRIDEIHELKKSLAKMLVDNGYRFAIVDDAVSSSEISSMTTINFVISVISHATDLIRQVHEDIDLRKKIADACGVDDHHCVVAGEDMMSDYALQKVYGLPLSEDESC